MKRADIAREIAQSLFTAENALDTAIRDFARLTADLMEARSRMGLAATVGPQVVSRGAAVQAALAAARIEAAALHAALAEVKDGVGLRTVSVGAGDKMDDSVPEWPTGAAVHPLRAAGLRLGPLRPHGP